MTDISDLVTTKLCGIAVECNYPDDTVEANIPQKLTVYQLFEQIQKLLTAEPEMTSFTIAAARDTKP